jgi:hypothetical protein
MKLHRIAILICLGFGSFFQLVRAEEPLIMLTFNGQRFGCLPVLNVPYTAEETTSELRTGNWWEVKRRVFVARDSQGRTLRRERTEHMFVNGAPHPNYTTVTINDPSADTFTSWVEGVEGETSIAVSHSYPSCAPRLPKEARETLIGTGPGAVVAYDKEWLLGHPSKFPMYEDIHSELLGERVVEGLTVEGLRSTMATPVGPGIPDAISTGDTWYSPELQVALITAQTPRPGETTKVELKKIRLEEPDPDLFKVPDGYHLAEEHKP